MVTFPKPLKPATVLEDEECKFQCEISTVKELKAYWFLDDKELKVNKNIKISHEGKKLSLTIAKTPVSL